MNDERWEFPINVITIILVTSSSSSFVLAVVIWVPLMLLLCFYSSPFSSVLCCSCCYCRRHRVTAFVFIIHSKDTQKSQMKTRIKTTSKSRANMPACILQHTGTHSHIVNCINKKNNVLTKASRHAQHHTHTHSGPDPCNSTSKGYNVCDVNVCSFVCQVRGYV